VRSALALNLVGVGEARIRAAGMGVCVTLGYTTRGAESYIGVPKSVRKMAGKTNYFLKVAAALFAVGLLAKLLRESFRRPKNASSDTFEGRQQHMREVRFVDGEERTEGITEREDELGVQRTEEELRAGTRERSGPSSCAYHPTARKQRHRREAPAGKPRCPVAACKDAGKWLARGRASATPDRISGVSEPWPRRCAV
jgi:hypothetical protein